MEIIKQQFTKLIEEGRKIVQASWQGNELKRHPSSQDYLRFRTEALNLIRRSCGEASDHYRELKRLAEGIDSANDSYYTIHCLGIVEAAQRDFDAGLLFDMRSLIAADILGDFLEQAETLLKAEYYVPAASLAGAVLEDTLRKLCEKNKIQIPKSTKIDSLNTDLYSKNIYDKLIMKRITAIADIRNNADHGHFEKVKKEDVEDMLKWVRSFSADYLQ